jgi:DNA-binding NarL/FixJ family response regulator
MVNVFVIDAHAIYRRGIVAWLRDLPEVAALTDAAGADEARKRPELACAHVLVIDHDTPGAHELMHELSARDGPCMIICSSRCGERDIVAATRSGAVGVLSKAALTPEALAAAVRAAVKGAGVLAPELFADLLAGARANGTSPPPGLTARELRVLRLIADGHQTREVARELSYSERTVKSVLHDAATKLHARSRSHAVAQAVRSGLI